MSTIQQLQRMPYIYIGLVALLFVLAACGPETARGAGVTAPGGVATETATPPSPTAQATLTPGSTSVQPAPPLTPPTLNAGTENGCPSNVVVSNPPPRANVILLPKNANSPIAAHVGDTIEAQMPFGQEWSSPLKTQGNLTLQTPSGYASDAAHACIWRFIASSPGTALLNFYARPICKPGYMCAMYIVTITFTVKVS